MFHCKSYIDCYMANESTSYICICKLNVYSSLCLVGGFCVACGYLVKVLQTWWSWVKARKPVKLDDAMCLKLSSKKWMTSSLACAHFTSNIAKCKTRTLVSVTKPTAWKLKAYRLRRRKQHFLYFRWRSVSVSRERLIPRTRFSNARSWKWKILNCMNVCASIRFSLCQ